MLEYYLNMIPHGVISNDFDIFMERIYFIIYIILLCITFVEIICFILYIIHNLIF